MHDSTGRASLLRQLASGLALATALAAQSTIVSPAGLATAEGNTSNIYPHWGTSSSWTPRYMQIHSDLGATALVLKQLAFRMNGGTATFAGPTTLDAELWVGSSVSWDRASWVYASNYVLPPTNVVPRTTLNLQNIAGGSTPCPFAIKLPFTTPALYLPSYSLAWEIRVYSTSGPANPSFDMHAASTGTGGSDGVVGTGCVATGQTSAMALLGGSATYGSAFTMGYYVDRGPPNAPTVLAIGAANPSLTIPGLCGTILTDLVVTHAMGSTDATGFLGELAAVSSKYAGGGNGFAFPNTFAGATFYLQAHSLDPGRPNAIQVSSSHGRQVTVGSPGLATQARATRLYGFNIGLGLLNPNALHFTTSIGYAIVAEFTY